jgi:uncharacterized membrane protein YqhA
MVRKLIGASRYLAILPVIGSAVAGITLLMYTLARTWTLVSNAITDPALTSKSAKGLAVGFIEVIDLFLLSIVFYLIALGLYELFIDDQIPLPVWLEIHHLDDLKAKLVGVIIPVLGVVFLGQALTWDGETNLLLLGAPIALVIAALTYFLTQIGRH